MNKKAINRACWIVPTVLSVFALALVLFAVATGREERADEGLLTHTFWLLIAVQAPFMAGFAATADWTKAARIALPIALQAAGLALAFGSVAFFKL